ncbi:MAG: triose-phosphate isomerase [Chloroflexota bacterium]
MRTPIMAGNWKMNKTISEAVALAEEVEAATASINGVEVVLCPPFIAISAVADAVSGSDIQVGAQNMYWEAEGAFTGEISPVMLTGLCQHVILGHSERRQYFAETDVGVNQKAKAALAHNLLPIICCGEDLAQNEAGQTETIVGDQVRAALDGLSAEQAASVVIAYEPIWAIGTGKAAEPEAVNEIIDRSIRQVVSAQFDEATSQAIRVQYGGSVKPGNVDGFLSQENIDGALVGGASLTAENFVPLVSAAAKTVS